MTRHIKISKNDEETLTGDKEYDKIDKIGRVDKNNSDERYRIKSIKNEYIRIGNR